MFDFDNDYFNATVSIFKYALKKSRCSKGSHPKSRHEHQLHQDIFEDLRFHVQCMMSLIVHKIFAHRLISLQSILIGTCLSVHLVPIFKFTLINMINIYIGKNEHLTIKKWTRTIHLRVFIIQSKTEPD